MCIRDRLTEALTEISEEDTDIAALVDEIIYKFEKMTVRRMILREHKRPDGREMCIRDRV